MGQVLGYTRMLIRAYMRDWVALFFGFFFPLIFMSLFGVLNFGSFGHVSTGVADEANNADSAQLIAAFTKIGTLQVHKGSRSDELAALDKGDRDIVLVIPADFRIAPVQPGQTAPTITMYQSTARAEQSTVGASIVQQFVDQLSFDVTRTAPVVTVKREEVAGRNLKYVDFLTPGIVGMTIMQLGIASVMFTFVVDRQRGVIRRIMATPISRRAYMAAHVLERLILAVLQVGVLIAVAVLLFKVQIVGSMAVLLLLTVLGSALFLCLGFATSAFVTTEQQAPAVMQLITLPQMFLSGVFFSRDVVPSFLKPISDYLPLTFLNDALRQVATAGASLVDIRGDLVGLVLWAAVTFVLAFRFFRLET